MKNTSQIKLGAILSYVVLGLNMLVGLIYTPIMSRILGQAEYGVYSLVNSIISYISVLDCGFGAAIIIYATRYRTKNDKEKEQKLYGMFLIIYTIIGVIATTIGFLLYLNVNNIFGANLTLEELKNAKIMLLILTFNMAITFPFSIFSNIIVAYEKFIFSKLVNIIRIILTPGIILPLLFLGYRSVTMVIVITILNIACLLANYLYCKKKLEINIKFDFNKILFKEIFSFSFFVFLNDIVAKVSWNIDQFILGMVSGSISVAIYSAAAYFNQTYVSCSTAINSVLLPKVIKMVEQKNDSKEVSELFIRVGRIQYIVLGLIMTGFILFGKQVIVHVWGNEYSNSYIVALILMLPATVPLIQNFGINILQANNKIKFRSIVYTILAIGNFIISIPLAKQYGPIGSAIGTAISLVIGQIVIINIYYYKVIHIDIFKFWKEIIKMTLPILIVLLLSILCVKIVGEVTLMMLIVEILLYTIVYSIAIWFFALNNYEKEIILKPIKKVIKLKGNE